MLFAAFWYRLQREILHMALMALGTDINVFPFFTSGGG
jgi:hypothetical protein